MITLIQGSRLVNYLQFTTPRVLSRDVSFVQININENHWLLPDVLPNFEKNSVICILLCFFRRYTSVHRIIFNKEQCRYYNHRVIRKQGNQSDCGIWVLLNAFAKTNNSLDIKLKAGSVKWRHWALDCGSKVFSEDLNSFNSTFDKHFLETVKHSHCLQNNELTKRKKSWMVLGVYGQ